MSPKPSSSTLAASAPAKPSVNTLPTPAATTGMPYGTTGTSVAQSQSATGAAPATNPAGTGYYTGPYGMAGQAPNTLQTTSQPSTYAATGYGGATAPAAAQTPYGGYQAPYQSSAGTNGSAYRTADTRSAYGGAGTAGGYGGAAANTGYGATAPAAPAAAPTNSWNNDQYARGGSQPAGYTEGLSPRSSEPAPSNNGAWAPPASSASAAPGGYPNAGVSAASAIPSTTTPAAPRSTGGYRPGSTGRAGTLPTAPATGAAPATSSYAPPASNYQPGAYPTSSYPSSSYPSTDPAAPRTAGTAGGYSYPSTTTTR